mgnify:CR=1 FL=1
MATINLIAIVFLSSAVSYVTQDYLRQRHEGKNPTCQPSEHPEIAPGVSKTIWK